MNSSSVSSVPASLLFNPRRAWALVLGLSVLVISSTLFGQADPNAGGAENPTGRQRRGQNGGAGGPAGPGGGGRGNFDPAEMQARMEAQQRELYGVTDDAEWKLISERIAAVTELRRTTLMAGLGNA